MQQNNKWFEKLIEESLGSPLKVSKKLITKTYFESSFTEDIDNYIKENQCEILYTDFSSTIYKTFVSGYDTPYIIKKAASDCEQSELKAINIQNKIHKKGHAAKVYFCIYLPSTEDVVMLMDFVKGSYIAYFLEDFDIIDRFFYTCEKLFNKEGLYHGDFNPRNILYDEESKKFTFIDFTYHREQHFEHLPKRCFHHFYDYVCMLYFMSPFDEKISRPFLEKLFIHVRKFTKTNGLFEKTIETIEKFLSVSESYRSGLLDLGNIVVYLYEDNYDEFHKKLESTLNEKLKIKN